MTDLPALQSSRSRSLLSRAKRYIARKICTANAKTLDANTIRLRLTPTEGIRCGAQLYEAYCLDAVEVRLHGACAGVERIRQRGAQVVYVTGS